MIRIGICGVALFFCSASLHADELRTLGGKTISGNLTAVSDTSITMTADDGPVVTPLSQVLTLDFRQVKALPPEATYSDVRLLDDSLLHCQAVAFLGSEVELTLLSGAALKIPLNALSWMVRDAHHPSLRKKFDDLLAQKSRRDRIVILRDMDLSTLDGTLGDVDAKQATIEFRRDGADAIKVLFERLHGLVFFRLQAPTATPICRVTDTDGNVLIATQLGLTDTECLVTTSFGATVALKRETLAKLDFNMNKLTYLSDLEPAKVVERSGIGLVTHYRKDANLDGEPIVLEKQHPKGLSLHAHTELSYDLAGKYKEFKARLGVDVRTGSDSQAHVAIYCDGEKRFAEVVTAKTHKDVAFSVQDVRTLRIVVSSRNFLDLHDHATLADARVSQ